MLLAQLRCSRAGCCSELLVGSLTDGWSCAVCGAPAREYAPRVQLPTAGPPKRQRQTVGRRTRGRRR